MKYKLESGDYVYLRESSVYNIGQPHNPIDVRGLIHDVRLGGYHINWDNGETNTAYTDKDVMLESEYKGAPVITKKTTTLTKSVLLQMLEEAYGYGYTTVQPTPKTSAKMILKKYMKNK